MDCKTIWALLKTNLSRRLLFGGVSLSLIGSVLVQALETHLVNLQLGNVAVIILRRTNGRPMMTNVGQSLVQTAVSIPLPKHFLAFGPNTHGAK